MAITIKDVAKKSGVSIATVSRIMNGNEKVNHEMKEKVLKVLKETGYKPNALARGLINKKTGVIGVIVPDFSNINFAELVKGIEQYSSSLGYTTLVGNTMNDAANELAYFDIFSEKRVDGIIFSGSILTEKHKKYFKNFDIPVVVYGQDFPELNFPWVNIDNSKASYEATKKLIELGHRNIAFISGPIWDRSAGYERYAGFLKAIVEKGISPSDIVIEEGDFTLKSGYDAMERVLRRTKPTALIAANDFMAIGAIKYLSDNSISVPNDISVMGFDDIQLAEMYNPSLSSVHIDFYELGRAAVESLINTIKGEEVKKQRILPYKIIERRSIRNV